MATTLVPGTHTGYDIDKWQRTVEGATYQKMVFIPTIDEGDRPLNLLHIRKHARVTGQELSQTAAGTSLTYAVLTGTPVTLAPTGSYIAVAWSENMESQIEFNLDSEARGELEQSLAELTETNQLANVNTATQTISGASVDATILRQAVGRLIGNTNGVAFPDGKPMIHGVFSNTQYPALVAIPEVNSAEARGDSENPFVKGIWVRGFGFMLNISTVVEQDGSGWHNPLYVPSAFVIAWNVRTRLKRQDDELENRLILYNNVAGAVKHDLRVLDVITTASQL